MPVGRAGFSREAACALSGGVYHRWRARESAEKALLACGERLVRMRDVPLRRLLDHVATRAGTAQVQRAVPVLVHGSQYQELSVCGG